MVSAFWLTNHNFGDNLNHYLLGRLAKNGVTYTRIESSQRKIVAIGTILNWCDETCIAWGPGLGGRDHHMNPIVDVRAVRGPLTAARARECGAKVPDVFGDPGLLLPLVYKPPNRKHFSIGIIPHYVDQAEVFERYNHISSEILLIDILDTPEVVAGQINACDRIISSSLHGIIAAHAYGIPASWARFSDRIGGDGMKYLDHYTSVGLHIEDSVDLTDFPSVMEMLVRSAKHLDMEAYYDPRKLLAAAPFEFSKSVGIVQLLADPLVRSNFEIEFVDNGDALSDSALQIPLNSEPISENSKLAMYTNNSQQSSSTLPDMGSLTLDVIESEANSLISENTYESDELRLNYIPKDVSRIIENSDEASSAGHSVESSNNIIGPEEKRWDGVELSSGLNMKNLDFNSESVAQDDQQSGVSSKPDEVNTPSPSDITVCPNLVASKGSASKRRKPVSAKSLKTQKRIV